MLVNSAVYFCSKGLAPADADWEQSWRVNVMGVANAVQACHPFMRRARELAAAKCGALGWVGRLRALCCTCCCAVPIAR